MLTAKELFYPRRYDGVFIDNESAFTIKHLTEFAQRATEDDYQFAVDIHLSQDFHVEGTLYDIQIWVEPLDCDDVSRENPLPLRRDERSNTKVHLHELFRHEFGYSYAPTPHVQVTFEFYYPNNNPPDACVDLRRWCYDIIEMCKDDARVSKEEANKIVQTFNLFRL